jgi:hypothetical protein
MIVYDAEALVALAERRRSLQQLVAEAKQFASRDHQVSVLLSRVRSVVVTEALFREQNVGHPVLPTNTAAAAQAAAALLTSFVVAPEAVLEGFKDLDKRVTAFLDRFEKAIRETWVAYASGKARSDNEDLLAVLEKIPDFKPTVKRVRALRAQLLAQTEKIPTTLADLSAFHETLADMAAAWSTLGSDAVPQTVIDFLQKAVSSEGARLDLLLGDPAIVKWLKDKTVMPAFCIRLAEMK